MKKKYNLVDIILFIAPLLVGLSPLWSLYIFSLVCIIGIVCKICKNKKIILPKGKEIILILVYILSFLIVEFYAIDKGMNMLAFFKNMSILFFIILILQYNYNENDKKNLFNIISYSAVFSVILSLLMAILGMHDSIFYKDRFQGIFFYANSYGLFLALGLSIILFKKRIEKKDYVLSAILALGIILTNSRAIIILTTLLVGIILILNKKNRKIAFTTIILLVVLFGIGYSFSLLEERINTEMLESGEFLTRFLYYKDALNMIVANPFGYGYNGFYYKQVEVQTGVYDTQFAHNAILQIALDVGIVPLLCLSTLLILIFLKKGQSIQNRVMLILIIGHSLIDFDLEYLIFIMIICMMIDFDKFEIREIKWIKVIGYIFAALYLLLVIATFSFEVGDYSFACKLVPFYTDAWQEYLYSEVDVNEQRRIARKILPLNENVSGAHQALSMEAQENEDFEIALKHEQKRLNLNKYAMINYLEYADFLNAALQYYNKISNEEKVKEYMSEILLIEDKIERVVEDTNPLCYKTQHVPNLEIPEQLEEFLSIVKSLAQEYE